MDDYVSAFMVTPEGIILVEPVGTEMATWLKAELARPVQCSGQVRHLQPFALGSCFGRCCVRGYSAIYRAGKTAQEYSDASVHDSVAAECTRSRC
jgi:hypothetical protein